MRAKGFPYADMHICVRAHLRTYVHVICDRVNEDSLFRWLLFMTCIEVHSTLAPPVGESKGKCIATLIIQFTRLSALSIGRYYTTSLSRKNNVDKHLNSSNSISRTSMGMFH